MGPFKWTPSVSISEGFGKTNTSTQMLFTSSQQKSTDIIPLEGEERKQKFKGGEEKNAFSETENIDGKEAE